MTNRRVLTKYAEFGKRLQKERLRIGLTQADLAKSLGVDKSSVYGYERGDRPPPASHLVVLSELGADILFIVTGQRVGTSINDEWLDRTMAAVREISDTGIWDKIDWNERRTLVARLIRDA